MEREAQLLEWRLTLTEERNAVMVPSAGSGIPGAPAEWCGPRRSIFIYLFGFFNVQCPCDYRVPLPGMETHIPVLFLNLKGKSVLCQ